MASSAKEGGGSSPGPRSHRRSEIWQALALVEFAVIVILATGMGYLATHQEQEEGERGAQQGHPQDAVDHMNRTLQLATDQWQACQNRTRRLEANSSALRSEVAQLSTYLRRQELENKALQGELAILRNWTQKLEDVNNQQKEIITHFQQEQKALSDRAPGPGGPPLLGPLLAVAILLHT